jgi:hypothetical protein
MITNAQGFRSFFDENPHLKKTMKDIIFTVEKSNKKQASFDFFNDDIVNAPSVFTNEDNTNNNTDTDTTTPNKTNLSNHISLSSPKLTPKLSASISLPKNSKEAKEDPKDEKNVKEDTEEWKALFEAFKKSMTYLVFTEPNYLVKNGVTSAISGENANKITDKILSQPEKFKTFLENANELIVTVKEKMDYQEENRINHARNLEDHINQMDAVLETKSFGFNPEKRARFLAHYENALEYQKDKDFSMMPTNPLTLAKPF